MPESGLLEVTVGTQLFHTDSFFSLMYAHAEDTIMDFYPPGALESFITSDRRAPLPPYISSAEKETRDRIFPSGYRAPTNRYRALSDNLGQDEDIQEGVDLRIRCPVLVITKSPSIATVPGFEN